MRTEGNKMEKVKSPGAAIINSQGLVIPIQFVCVDCSRVAIWTNEFNQEVDDFMQCPNCFSFSFRVKASVPTTCYFILPDKD